MKIKKFFYPKGFACSFCQRTDHNKSFCPCLPTEPAEEDRKTFVDKLLGQRRQRLEIYEGMEWEEACEKMLSLGSKLNEENPWKGKTGGEFDLRKKLGFWKALGADKTVLSWIGYGVDMKFHGEPSRVRFPNHPIPEQYEAFVDKEIKKHLDDKLLKVISPGEAHVVHPMMVALNGSKPRLCDDLRYVNAFLASPAFKMQSLKEDIPEVVEPEYEMVVMDLKKAYYKVMMTPRARKYQCRYWKGKFYEPSMLLFGGCQAPFVFTKLCRPIVRFLGCIIMAVLNFIDDWIFADRKQTIDRLKLIIKTLFEALGWTFNDEKEQQGTRVLFLGYILDSLKRTFEVPTKKAETTISVLEAILTAELEGKSISTDELRTLLGKLGSMTLAIPSIPVWTRALYSPWKGLSNAQQPPAKIELTKSMVEEVHMLTLLLKQRNGGPFMNQKWEVDVFVDSSEIGYGATILGLKFSGLFPSELIGTSSTRRELEGLLALARRPDTQLIITNKVIRWNMDSSCAIVNLTKGGGPVDELCQTIKDIWIVLDNLKSQAVFRWLSREEIEMKTADKASKTLTFWLKPEAIDHISQKESRNVYCVPYNQIARELEMILARRDRCALVVPKWEAKSWWPPLVRATTLLQELDLSCIAFSPPELRSSVKWKFCLALFF